MCVSVWACINALVLKKTYALTDQFGLYETEEVCDLLAVKCCSVLWRSPAALVSELGACALWAV